MNIANHASLALSVVLFLAYGIHILFLQGMVEDFERFGLRLGRRRHRVMRAGRGTRRPQRAR